MAGPSATVGPSCWLCQNPGRNLDAALLAVRRYASYGVEYDALLAKPQFTSHLTYVPSANSGLQMMAAGRVDGWLADELSGMITIREMGFEKVIAHSKLVTADNGDLVAFSKATSSPAFVKKFTDAMGSMVKDGSYKKVLERFLPCTVSRDNQVCYTD